MDTSEEIKKIESRLNTIKEDINLIHTDYADNIKGKITTFLYDILKGLEEETPPVLSNDVTYIGGTLFFTVLINKTSKPINVFVNLDETCNIDYGDYKIKNFLLPLDAVRMAFHIYLKVKGQTDYFKEKFNKSCLRHLVS